MAVATYDNSQQVYGTGGISALTSANWAIGGSNRCVWFSLFSGDSGNISSSGAKWQGSGGTSATRVGSEVAIGSYWSHGLWELIAPAAATDSAYGTWASTCDELLMVCMSSKDTDQTTPKGTVATGTGTTSSPSVNVSTASGELVFDFLAHADIYGNATPSLTVGSNQTSRQEIEGLAPTGGYEQMGCSTSTAASSTEAMDWTIAGNSDPIAWSMFAFQVNGVSGGGGGTTVKTLAATGVG